MRRLLRILCAISAISVVGGEATARADQLAFTDWQATTPFDGPRASHAAVLANNRIYILGGLYASGNSFTLYNDVQTALLGNDGSIAKGSWTKTTPFAEPRSGMGVALYKGFLYVVGGFSNQGTLADVQYAGLMPDGMLGSWTASPNRLAIPRSNFALEVFVTASGANYLVAIAGVGSIGKDTVRRHRSSRRHRQRADADCRKRVQFLENGQDLLAVSVSFKARPTGDIHCGP